MLSVMCWFLKETPFKWLAIFASTWAVSTLSVPSRQVDAYYLATYKDVAPNIL